jgi:hypothetical protein
MGVSGAALQYMTKDTLAEVTDDPVDRVPRIRRVHAKNTDDYHEPPYPGDPVLESEYYTIPRDKWIRVEAPKDAAMRVNKKISQMERLGQAVAVVSHSISAHRQQKVIRVYHTKDERFTQELRRSIPDEIDGVAGRNGEYSRTVEDIPVVFNKLEMSPDGGNLCGDVGYNNMYEDVPGGCRVGVERPDGHPWHTSCTPVWDYDNGEMSLAISGHGTIDQDDGEPPSKGVGREVWQQPETYGGEKIGEVDRVRQFDTGTSFIYNDCAVMRFTEERIHMHKLANTGKNSYGLAIQGYVAEDALHDMHDSGDSLQRQGSASTLCEGQIEEVFVSSATDASWLKIDDSQSTDGDSGGPYFDVQEGASKAVAVIAGIHYGQSSTAYPMTDAVNDMNFTVP